MNKKYWFGQSLAWIGVLSNSPDAIAETVAPPTPNPARATQASSLEGVQLASPTISAPELIGLIERSPDTLTRLNDSSSVNDSFIGSPLTALEVAEEAAVEENHQETVNFSGAIDPEPDNSKLDESNLAIEPDQIEPVQSSPTTNTAANADAELGRLRLRESELAIEQEEVDTVFLRGRLDYFRSDNILLDDFDPVADQLARAGLSIVAVPQLSPSTQLLASVGGSFAFYGDLSELNYSNLEFRAEVEQTIFPNTYATIGWSNRQFFSSEDGDRFLNNHAVRLALSRRDLLTEQLSLNSYYQLRFNFADPVDRSRLTNTIGASLNYALQPDLDLGLNYELDLTDFTQQDRNDAYHQVTAQLGYDLTRNSRVSLYGGFSFGRSSESDVDFDSSILGISFSTYLPLF